MSDEKCVVCDRDPIGPMRWTDTHGVAVCVCGAPYKIYHYEGEGDERKRVDKPPALAIKPEWVPIARKYHAETGGRVFPGSYDMGIFSGRSATYSGATLEDMDAFNAYIKAHGEELPQ